MRLVITICIFMAVNCEYECECEYTYVWYIENLCVRNERFAKAKSLRPTLVFLAL